ncbi:MAG: ABC transporter permease [Clostridiales bacterium]|nr:ABC transporter permease [Clostridiales bacterium]
MRGSHREGIVLGKVSEIKSAEKKSNGTLDRLKKLLINSGALVALVLLCLFLSILSPDFLTVNNIMNIARQSSINGLVSAGMLLVILTAGTDLSVGSILAFSSALMGISVVHWGVNPLFSILLCLATGSLIGWINGLILTELHVPHPFISTMGSMNVFRGLTLIIMNATPISGMPKSVKFIGAEFIGIVPVSFMLLLIVYVIFHFLLKNTTIGRHIYAVGGNIEAARLSGIDVKKVLWLVYSFSGFMSALAGIVLAGRVDSVYPLAGTGYELDAIASVIIGGASFFGGIGSIWGTLVGVLIMGVLRNGLNLLNVSSNLQSVAIGLVIVAAVCVDVFRQRTLVKNNK